MSQGYTNIINIPLDTDVTLSGNSDFVASSQKAVKTYVDTTASISATTKVQNGLNTYTGGTLSQLSINVSDLTINTLITSGNTSLQAASATTLSATSISSSTISVTNSTGGTSFFVDSFGKVNVGTSSLTGSGTTLKFRVMNGGAGIVDFGQTSTNNNGIWFNKTGGTGINFSVFNFAASTALNTTNVIFFNISASTQVIFSNRLLTFGSGLTSYDLTFPSTGGTRIATATTTFMSFWGSQTTQRPTSGTPINTVLYTIGLQQSATTNVQFTLPVSISGNTTLATIGSKLIIASGTNASVGVVTLTAGTATVNNTLVTNSSIIKLTPQTLGTITRPVGLGVTGRTAGTSFTIVSQDPTDTSIVGWMITEPI